MTEPVEIETPEGESVEIEVEQFSELQKMRWAAKAPDAIKTDNPHRIDVTPELLDYLIELVESQTILTRELLNELEQEQLSTVFNGVVTRAFGVEQSDDGEIEGFSEEIEFNEDGSVDLDEWE